MRMTLCIGVALSLFSFGVAAADLSPMEQLGKALLFDTNLSTPEGQSCAACHAPEVGYTGPVAAINAAGAVYPGAVSVRFGNRKPPAVAYSGFGPLLHYSEDDGLWEGGTFWDGRATGWTLGDPLAEQAQGPFLNPLEQNNPQAKTVVYKVRDSSYANLFRQVWGADSLSGKINIDLAYEQIARSIAAYERSAEVNPFTSKYDYYLKGQATLSDAEARGLALFEGKAKCSLCHLSQPGADDEPPLFTDYTFDNLGVPKNPDNPFYSMGKKYNPDGKNWIDTGLGGFLQKAGYPAEVYEPEWGKQQVPTLRNVDKRPSPGFVKAYGHNGYFKSLEEIVHFYNTRDVEPWPPAEVPGTVNTEELGNLGLSTAEEADLVQFLKTLTDGYTPVP
jgi:cytochrome c peroxidase